MSICFTPDELAEIREFITAARKLNEEPTGGS